MCTIFVVVVVKYLRGLPTKSYKNLYIIYVCIMYRLHTCMHISILSLRHLCFCIYYIYYIYLYTRFCIVLGGVKVLGSVTVKEWRGCGPTYEDLVE